MGVLVLCNPLIQEVPFGALILKGVLDGIVLIDDGAKEIPEQYSVGFLSEGSRIKNAIGLCPGEHKDGEESIQG